MYLRRFSKCAMTAAALILASPLAWSECAPTGCLGLVEKVYASMQGGGGTTYLQIAGTRSLVTGCTMYSPTYFILPGDQPGSKSVMATVLIAQATNSQVNVRVVPDPANSNYCTVAYVVLEP